MEVDIQRLSQPEKNDEKNEVEKNTKASDLNSYYERFSRPGLSKLLKTLRMQQCYFSAEGDYLYYKKNEQPVRVLDALGGFGACLFGHNHPYLVEKLQSMLISKTPVLAQGSTRTNAALLGKRLNDLLWERFNEDYVSIVLNTGADAVEAAIKHSELCRKKRLSLTLDHSRKAISRIKKALRHQRLSNVLALKHQVDLFLGEESNGIDESLASLEACYRRLESTRPTLLALKRGYHGKTTGALQLTYGEAYRDPFSRLGPQSLFVDPKNHRSLIDAIAASSIQIPMLEFEGEAAQLKERSFANVTAMFCEPLQGEGGIRPIESEFLKQCESICQAENIPFVLDEIQSGMGRTGTFLYCEQLGINPDIVLLSKSLGGGLCKLSTTSIKCSIYDPDFDEVHSSTFAEDDLSAGVALAALDLIQNTEAMNLAKTAGQYLKKGLLELKSDYPEIVDDVRGEGLFLGFAIKPKQDSASFVIRFLSQADKLGYVIAGYLLHEHDIRIGTTLSDTHVLRIEPSLYITEQQSDLIISSLRHVCEILKKANAYELSKYLVGKEKLDSERIIDFSQTNCGTYPSYEQGLPTVTFVATPASASHVMDSDISLKLFSNNEVVQLLAQIVEVLGPVETETRTIASITGKKINFRMLILMYDPVFISARLASGYLQDILENICTVQEDSEERHHTVLGLGSYTSIVSQNGLALTSDSISLTTGNALTVGMGARAILKTANEKHINMGDAVMAVLGAGGNIGSVYSEVLADEVPKLVLIGRENRLEKLYQTAIEIYRQAHLSIIENRVGKNSIADQLSENQIYQEWKTFSDGSDASYRDLAERLWCDSSSEAPVVVTSDMYALKQANLILTCSNAPKPIVKPEMLGKHETVICDVSVPQDVDDSVAYELDNVELIRGGLVRLPRNPEILWMGNQCLGSGVSYACMAETMLLGLEGQKEHGSYGKISKQEVKRILDIADIHGFELAKIKVEKVF